jgi:hypothetical protein
MHAWNVQPTYKELLTRLNIASTFDTAAARRTIEALDAQGDASGKPESRPSQFRIVVLDTVTALLAPQLSGISSQGNVIATTLHPRTSARSLFVLSNTEYRVSANDDDEHGAANAPLCL